MSNSTCQTGIRGRRRPGNGAGRYGALEPIPLGEAAGLAALEVNQTLRGPWLEISFSKWPDVLVGPDVRDMIRAWVAFLAAVADSSEASLYLCGCERQGGIDMSLVLYLHQASDRMIDPSGTLEEAAALLERMGGDFQIDAGYPEVAVRLRIPVPAARPASRSRLRPDALAASRVGVVQYE